MKDHIRLLRPKHYLKNVLVLLPLFFSGRFFERALLGAAAAGFAAFCLLSSFIYIINDVRDVESDRRHPTKCRRPIASGAVSVHAALTLAAALAAAVTAIGVLARFPAGGWGCMAVYLLVNLGYSFGLKNVPILDIALLVSGFLLRVLFGAAVTGIGISSWLYLTVVSVSFYLALGKRRGGCDQPADNGGLAEALAWRVLLPRRCGDEHSAPARVRLFCRLSAHVADICVVACALGGLAARARIGAQASRCCRNLSGCIFAGALRKEKSPMSQMTHRTFPYVSDAAAKTVRAASSEWALR